MSIREFGQLLVDACFCSRCYEFYFKISFILFVVVFFVIYKVWELLVNVHDIQFDSCLSEAFETGSLCNE